MTADVFTIRSRNPHADCRAPGGFPCQACRDQRQAERDAHERHPAGAATATEWEAARPWDCGTSDGYVYLDAFARLDDEWLCELDDLMFTFRERRDELAHSRVSGEPEEGDYSDPELLARISDVQDHLRILMRPAKARAVASALSTWADRTEEPS